MAQAQEFIATGRRKTSVARIRMTPGSGKIDINGRNFGFFGVGAPAGDIAPAVGAAAGIGAVGAAIIGGAPGPAGGAGKLAAPGAGFGRSGGFNERNCLIASPAQIVSMRSSRVPSVCGPGIRYFVRISSQTRRASSIRFFAFNNGTSEISASGPL